MSKLSPEDMTEVARLVDEMMTDQDRAYLADQNAARDEIYTESKAMDMDRPVSEDDMRMIYGGARVRFHRAYFGDDGMGPEDLTHAALFFACQEWMNARRPTSLFWPTAPLHTPTFAYNLIDQMAAASVNPQAQALSSLAVLCIDLALSEIDVSVDVPRSAFFAGLAYGQMGQAKVTTVVEVLKDRMAKIEKGRKASTDKRKRTFKEKARDKDASLLALASEMIAADPHTTDIQVQRRYRRENNLPATRTSNAESTRVGQMRREGRLPPRKPVTDDDHSSNR